MRKKKKTKFQLLTIFMALLMAIITLASIVVGVLPLTKDSLHINLVTSLLFNKIFAYLKMGT